MAHVWRYQVGTLAGALNGLHTIPKLSLGALHEPFLGGGSPGSYPPGLVPDVRSWTTAATAGLTSGS